MPMQRTFYVFGQSWYAGAIPKDRDFVEEINFGVSAFTEAGEEDGSVGEMALRWVSMGGKNVPRLDAFDDSWEVLAGMPEVVQYLGSVNDKNITPEDFAKALIGFGFVDKTARANPRAVEARPCEPLIEAARLVKCGACGQPLITEKRKQECTVCAPLRVELNQPGMPKRGA